MAEKPQPEVEFTTEPGAKPIQPTPALTAALARLLRSVDKPPEEKPPTSPTPRQ